MALIRHFNRKNFEPINEASMLSSLSPSAISFLPLVYVAWADGVLAHSELAELKSWLEQQDDIPQEDRKIIASWLDPDNPPNANQYQIWLQQIQNSSQELVDREGLGLADLGWKMASLQAGGDGALVPNKETLTALKTIEGVLGVHSVEARRELLDEEETSSSSFEEREEASFDPAKLQAVLDGDHASLRDKMRGIFSSSEMQIPYGLSTEEHREVILHRCKTLADEGLGSLSYPKTAGGTDDAMASLVVFETLGFFDISLAIKYGVQFGLFGGSILHLGTEKHHLKYLPGAGSLAIPGCFAMTERGHGSNVRDIETTATYDPESDELVIHSPNQESSFKEWIGNAATHGILATVFAQLTVDGESHGVHAILVPIRNEDGSSIDNVTIKDCGVKLGLNGVDNGQIWFDHVRVPRENLLDRFGSITADGKYESEIHSKSKRFFTMLSTLVGGRVSIASSGMSAAKSGLAIAIKYANKRRQFGPKKGPEIQLMDYLTHQRRLLIPLSNVYALDFALKELISTYVNAEPGSDKREIELVAAGLKAYSSWNTISSLQECREACGGMGYLEVNRFRDLKADTDIYATFEGDNIVLMQLVSKGLLAELKSQFNDMDVFGMVKYATTYVGSAITELNPVTPRLTDDDHLLSFDFHKDAFAYREERLLKTVGRRLKHRIDEGMDSFKAMIEVQDHLLSLAHAATEKILVDSFVKGIEDCKDESVKPILTKLAQLFALHNLEKDRGWFLENGYIEGGKSKAIRTLVNRLVSELRVDSEALVDAFGIPDACLRAPIAIQ